MFEAAITQEQFLVKEEDAIQSEVLIYEARIETVEPCDFQIDNLFINEGIISDDEVLMKCHREIALLKYLLENSEYDSVIAEEGVHNSRQEQEDIIRVDDVGERLNDSLMNSFENSK